MDGNKHTKDEDLNKKEKNQREYYLNKNKAPNVDWFGKPIPEPLPPEEAANLKKMYDAILAKEASGGGSALYLADGALLLCDKGKKPSALKVTPHNILVTGVQQANKTDCKAGTNIQPFGEPCDITKKPCVPDIVGEWMATNSENLVGGADSITMGSCLVCAKGGLIQPLTSGMGFVTPAMLGKMNPMTGAIPNADMQNKTYLCWATCASIMIRSKLTGDPFRDLMRTVIGHINNNRKYYSQVNGASGFNDQNGVRFEYAGYDDAMEKYYIDGLQQYLDDIFGNQGINKDVSQVARNAAIEALTGKKLTFGGLEENGDYEPAFFLKKHIMKDKNGKPVLDNKGNPQYAYDKTADGSYIVDEEKVKKYIVDPLEYGDVIVDAYKKDGEGGGHSFIIKKEQKSKCEQGKFRIYDPYTGTESKSYSAKELFVSGFTSEIFANDVNTGEKPNIVVRVSTGFAE